MPIRVGLRPYEAAVRLFRKLSCVVAIWTLSINENVYGWGRMTETPSHHVERPEALLPHDVLDRAPVRRVLRGDAPVRGLCEDRTVNFALQFPALIEMLHRNENGVRSPLIPFGRAGGRGGRSRGWPSPPQPPLRGSASSRLTSAPNRGRRGHPPPPSTVTHVKY
jgi:hypothetical protein